MTCEKYNAKIVEAVAASAAPGATLQAHLTQCPACRAAFEQERSLFAAIDTAVRATTNAEVPSSFLPRVRSRLVEVAVPRRMWTRPLIFAAASVALASTIFLFVPPHHSKPNDQAKQTPQRPVGEVTVSNSGHRNSGPGLQIVSSNVKNGRAPGHSTLSLAAASSQPEVLVPPDEREAFSRFVATVQLRGDVAEALLAPGPRKQDTLVTVESLQIENLELKPLEGRETEVSGRVGELR
jgi:hypothetical protein